MPFQESDSRRNLVAVGSVDFRSARLWFRAPGAGAYVLAVLVDFVEIEVDEQLEVVGALLVTVAFVVIAARLLVVRPRPG